MSVRLPNVTEGMFLKMYHPAGTMTYVALKDFNLIDVSELAIKHTVRERGIAPYEVMENDIRAYMHSQGYVQPYQPKYRDVRLRALRTEVLEGRGIRSWNPWKGDE